MAAAQDEAVPAFKQVDSLEARVQGCVTCHGQSGQGTSNGYFPRIAGKPAGYLYNQLVAFRDGTRRYAPMNYLGLPARPVPARDRRAFRQAAAAVRSQ
jgi:cytochrome c553